MATLTLSRARAGGRRDGDSRRRVASAACVVVIAGATLGDYATANDVTFGSVEVLAIAAAGLFLGTRRTVALAVWALLGQAIGVRLGLISGGAALVDAASIAAVATLLRWTARSSRPDTSDARYGPESPQATVPVVASVATTNSSDPLHTVVDIAPTTLLARGLTARECEVVQLSLVGLTASQIGRQLYIGRRTVETHLSRAYSKFGVHSRAEIAEELLAEARRLIRAAAAREGATTMASTGIGPRRAIDAQRWRSCRVAPTAAAESATRRVLPRCRGPEYLGAGAACPLRPTLRSGGGRPGS